MKQGRKHDQDKVGDNINEEEMSQRKVKPGGLEYTHKDKIGKRKIRVD